MPSCSVIQTLRFFFPFVSLHCKFIAMFRSFRMHFLCRHKQNVCLVKIQQMNHLQNAWLRYRKKATLFNNYKCRKKVGSLNDFNCESRGLNSNDFCQIWPNKFRFDYQKLIQSLAMYELQWLEVHLQLLKTEWLLASFLWDFVQDMCWCMKWMHTHTHKKIQRKQQWDV